jgi:hypothetical protein
MRGPARKLALPPQTTNQIFSGPLMRSARSDGVATCRVVIARSNATKQSSLLRSIQPDEPWIASLALAMTTLSLLHSPKKERGRSPFLGDHH